MSEEKISKERMMMKMLRFYEKQPGEVNYRLKRRVSHESGFGGWTPAELDELYLEMIRMPFLAPHVEPEEPSA